MGCYICLVSTRGKGTSPQRERPNLNVRALVLFRGPALVQQPAYRQRIERITSIRRDSLD